MIGFLISLILMPIILALAGLIGYFVGVLIVLIPGMNGIFADGLGLQSSAVPTILAWVFVIMLVRTWFVSNTDK